MKIISNMRSNSKEIIAGLTTFFTMSYIVIVNPLIWSTPGTGVSLSFALTATVILLVLINLLAGFFIKLPYAFGPGMGLNAFVVYTVILSNNIPFPIALGVIFWSSLLFILISILPVRQKIIEALPENLKHAMGCGIGLFLTFIGLKNLGFVVGNPDTLIQIGHLDLKIFLGFIGFCIATYFFIKNKSYAFLLSILTVTILAILTKQTPIPTQLFSVPDLTNVFAQIDIWGALKLSLLPTIISLLMTSLFDSISTIIGLSHSSGLREPNGKPKKLKQILFVDSFGSLLAGFVGTSPTAVFVESSAGIQAGGRTGIVPIVVALCFLPCLFLEPLIHIIPSFATAPILIFIGILMTLHIKHIDAKNFDDIVPVFMTIILMPLTSSITNGVIFGIVSYVAMKALTRKFNEISKTLWIVGIASLFIFLTAFTPKSFESTLKEAQLNAQKNSVLSSNFTQEYYSELRDKTSISQGKLFLKNDLFRWEITEPREQLYVNDGKFVWKYEKDFNLVEQFNVNIKNLEFIKLLNHLQNINHFYNISENTSVTNRKPNLLYIILNPKNTEMDQRKIYVSIEVKTGYVTELDMHDENGNKTKLTFDDFSKANIPDKMFTFTPPKDVIVKKFSN